MGVVIGMLVGYMLGTRAGPEGWDELQDAWKVIVTSEEVRDLLSGGFAVARQLVGQGSGFLADALGEPRRPQSLHSVA